MAKKRTNPELLEDQLKAAIFAVNPYYSDRAPKLKAKVRKVLTDPNATEADLGETVDEIEKLLRRDSRPNENWSKPMTMAVACKALGLSERQVRRRRGKGTLRMKKTTAGGMWVIHVGDLTVGWEQRLK